MKNKKSIKKAMLILLASSFIVRAFVAGFIELGNDEVYYRTYALFPDWSHFDHPPMVGWIIQLFTLNLTFSNEFFIRLGAVVLGTVNTGLIYLIGKKIKDEITGFYAAMLFTSSIYCFILSGIFILPDTPQVFFWLLTLWLLIDCLPDKELTRRSRHKLLWAGLSIGLAMLSKYHSVFLIAGAVLYITFYNRTWFRAKETWIAAGISILLFMPVIIWNYNNDFISFTFHESRVGYQGLKIRWDYFGTEMAGQFLYNNPVNFLLVILALIAVFRKRISLNRAHLMFLLLMSLPLAIIFIAFSLYSSTLPHWTGPAYLGLTLIASVWLSGLTAERSPQKLVPWSLRLALGLQFTLISVAVLQINFGILPLNRPGTNDFTAELQGWRQLGEKFRLINNKYVRLKEMPADAPIIAFRWFPAANLDYYVASGTGKKVYSLGTLNSIHKYYWIDKKQGDLNPGTDAWYIAPGVQYMDPHEHYGSLFDSVVPCDTIRIYRGKKLSWEAYVFRMYGLKRKISFSNVHDFIQPSDKRIGYWFYQIRQNPEMYKRCIDKSKIKGETVEDIIWNEASWMAEEEKHWPGQPSEYKFSGTDNPD